MKDELNNQKRSLIIIGIASVIILVVALFGMAFSQASSNASKSATNADAQKTNVSTKPTPTPSPTPAIITELSGSGSKQSDSFSSSSKWQIKYSYTCDSSTGYFGIEVKNVDGSSNDNPMIAETYKNSNSSSSYFYGAGQHYISVSSNCDWNISILNV